MNSRTLTIGRAPDNDLVISDGHISSHHARLLRSGNSITIEDLNSSNHVYVDGYQITRKQVNVGDSIQISYYHTLDWNNSAIKQWLSLGSSGNNLPVPQHSPAYHQSINAPASQWKAPDETFCSSCGAIVRSGMQFCNSCGASANNSVSSDLNDQHSIQSAYPSRNNNSLSNKPARASGSYNSNVESYNGTPEKCPNCGSTNIRKVSMHKANNKTSSGGCNGCLLLIIIAILAPGLILFTGVAGAIGLAGLGVFVSENQEAVIAGVSVFLIVSIIISVIKSKTYICEKCGNKFR